MLIFPAIDLIDGQAVRLLYGDYEQKTVYSDDPLTVVCDFKSQGAGYLHLVDLNGARSGTVDNFPVIRKIVKNAGMFVEVGGGIRNMETVDAYMDMGVDRVILGTAAIRDEAFLIRCLNKYGDKVSVGVDLKDGYAAIHGWTQTTGLKAEDLLAHFEQLGVSHVICTDISKDGAMKGTNLKLYERLSRVTSMKLTASGGVCSMEDIDALKAMNIYAAIIGKAYYTGAINLREAIER